MPAVRAVFVTVITLALGLTLVCGGAARAQPADPSPEASVDPFADSPAVAGQFGPRYVLEALEVRGNRKTRAPVIENAVVVHPGELISASDPRIDESRFRVLGLGLFEDVQLSLRRGSVRGHVVLVVDVVERGTILLNEIFLGNQAATSFWGGLDVSQSNFLGHGIALSGAFVLGSTANVPGAQFQQGYRVRLWDPDLRGVGFGLGGELLLNQGSEFFRASGNPEDATPADFVALDYSRVGGTLSGGFDLGKIARVRLSHRLERIDTTFPLDRTRTTPGSQLDAIDFQIREGASLLDVLGVAIDVDTRSDPVLPQSGFLLIADSQLSTRLWGSDYNYGKLTLLYDHYVRLPWRHVIAARLFGGVVFGGEAPFFEKFFVGDLNRLLPPRALGMNFSTQPSFGLLGAGAIRSKRYEDVAGRAALEYAIALWRGGRTLYGADFFASAGVFTLTSFDRLTVRDGSLGSALPFDLTLDVGVRLDTYIGIFTLSIGNAIGRIGF